MAFETELERWKEVEVLMLRVSSGMGKPGIDVPKAPASVGSNWEYGAVPVLGDPCSYSNENVGSSDCAGVRETRGGAIWDGAVKSEWGLSEVVLLETVELDVGAVAMEGRRGSEAPEGMEAVVWVVPVVVDVDATADEKESDMLFILEKKEVTRL